MRSYEMVFIVHPDWEEDELTEVVEDVEELIERNDGQVAHIDPWGMRKLAYPVKGQTEGQYIVLEFDLEPQAVAELEEGLQLIEPIIRHLVVRAE